nr:unnamed protein product [Sorex araneus]
MFGDLFEEDFSSVSDNQYAKGKKSQTRALEPPAPRESTNLSGIRNQGGTCYLNSLLQTLHFTPEFREALFSLGPEELGSLEDKDKPDAKVRVIPLQLQRLFAQLLLLDQEAASTEDLTDSFGWTGSEELRQHDVQELNRILFSALETSLVGTSGHDLINRLYHGTVMNQVVCKECQNVSERQEDFLDLTVAVKNVSSLEEALWNMYVEEEVFEHDNLYHCGACDRLVSAAKSARLRKLPPFLTVSLLRFSFDFVKCERYKETSCHTFPLRINLKPFCEQSELDDVEYIYDLFSVIIHKGGCYGGHYHVYIKDVDHLGNWQLQEEKNKLDVNLKGEFQDEEETADPLRILRDILLEESNQIPVDQLGQRLLKKIGVSWNQRFRKQCGSLRKFLQLHSQEFLLSSEENTVRLLNCGPRAESGSQRSDQCLRTLPPEPPAAGDPASRPHWFDINDSKVQPIEEKDLEQQFQGRESAYMLFYRQARLQRPPAALGNPRHGVPCHLLREMDAANTELRARRAQCDAASNSFELHLHLGPHYRFSDGALHPVASQAESVWALTYDSRRTLGDLRQSVLQLLESWEGEMVLSVAKCVPAGLHVYETLTGDSLTLSDAGIDDGEHIFVWNGAEVGGVRIATGSDSEPLLLNVLRAAPGGQGPEGQRLVESTRVFPASADVNAVLAACALPQGVMSVSSAECAGPERWATVPREDAHRTLRELGLHNGSCVLLRDSEPGDSSPPSQHRKWTARTGEGSWLQVVNLCPGEAAEKHVRVPAAANTVVFDIRIKAIKELKLMKDLADSSCLRPIDRNGRLLCPVPDASTVSGAELKLGSSLGLCPGAAPTPSQLFLFFAVGSDVQPGAEMEVIVEETESVRNCLRIMLEKAGLQGHTWHLRKMDWCYEAGEPLTDEGAMLKELAVRSGDTLLLMEGTLPPPGFLKVPIWWYQPRGPSAHWRRGQEPASCAPSRDAQGESGPGPHARPPGDSPLLYLGDVELPADATLHDLKAQAMTLPSFWEFVVPSPACLRAWTVEGRRPGRLLRRGQQPLREYKLGRKTEICLEPLQREESLGPQDVLLRTRMRLPGEREYALSEDLVWDTAQGWTASSLRQCVARFYALPVEKTEIAKYFPDKFEWLPVSSWSQQSTKRKKKKKHNSLQGAPYYLKDGDTIGIKNLLLEDNDDFSTSRDDVEKEKQKRAEGRRERPVALRTPSADTFQAQTPRPHGPEASLSIHVGTFR